MGKTRRGGYLTLSGDAKNALAAANKSVDEVVREHLNPEEMTELCELWSVEDADQLLKAMNSQPNFKKYLGVMVLSSLSKHGTRKAALSLPSVGPYAQPIHQYANKGAKTGLQTLNRLAFASYVAAPLVYGFKYLHGKYKDSAKSKETIRILLGAIQRLSPRKSGRKSGRVSTRRR